MKTRKHLFLKRQLLNMLALCTSDSLVLLAGLYLGNWIVYWIHGIPVSIHYALGVIPVWCGGAVIARVVPAWGIGAVEEFRRIQLLLLTVFALAGIVIFLNIGHVLPSRIVYLISYLFGALFIPLVRIPVKMVLLKAGGWGCPTALYGDVDQVSVVIDTFRNHPLLGYVPFGVFTNDPSAMESTQGVPVLGKITDHHEGASVAIVPVALAEDYSLSESFDLVFSGYQRVVLLPDIKEDLFLWALPRNLGGLMGLEITSNLLNPLARFFKYGIDLVLVILAAPLWVPLLVFISGIIGCVDRQWPFFMQHRVGRGNRSFRPFKFRTMGNDAEAVLEHALLEDASLRAEWDQNCKLRNDPRVTRIGKLLRRTSLDELPQVLNVLAGQMSLVGPRPLPDYHHEQLSEAARTPRSRVRPGMTGMWQISGRSDSGTAGMEKWDTYYVRNWSIWLDAVILARTVKVVLLGSGAY